MLSLNTGIVDFPWSVIHFTTGMLIGALIVVLLSRRLNDNARKMFWLGFLLLVIWEIYEAGLRLINHSGPKVQRFFSAFMPVPTFGAKESWWNIAGDLVIGGVGLLVGSWALTWIKSISKRTP